MKTLGVVAVCVMLSGSLGLVACDEAVQVAHDEMGPKALLNKYMLFKEMRAQLDKKWADIKLYHKRMDNMRNDHKDEPKSKWPRDERETYNQWETELDGIKASYNSLAAEYNAKMAEINWRFANVGTLPPGATEALPRDYAPYREE